MQHIKLFEFYTTEDLENFDELTSEDILNRIILSIERASYDTIPEELVALLEYIDIKRHQHSDILTKAIRRCNTKLVKLFLDAGLDPNYSGDMDYPLHTAAKFGFVKTIKMLINYGADIKIEDMQGRTAWDILNPAYEAELPELKPDDYE